MDGCRAAVANGGPELKSKADYVSGEEFGPGFCQIVDYMWQKR